MNVEVQKNSLNFKSKWQNMENKNLFILWNRLFQLAYLNYWPNENKGSTFISVRYSFSNLQTTEINVYINTDVSVLNLRKIYRTKISRIRSLLDYLLSPEIFVAYLLFQNGAMWKY